MGARGGGVTPTPSGSAAPALPLPLLPLLPLACLSPRSSPCGFPYQHQHSCQPLRVSLRASEGAREQALLRHAAAQPQPLRSACALEPTPCLIIQDMSTAFHRRALAREAGARPGRENAPPLRPALPQPRMESPVLRVLLKLSLYLSQLWGLPESPSLRPSRE